MASACEALKSMIIRWLIRIITVKSKDAVCAFSLSSNFVLDDVDFGSSGDVVNSDGVGGPNFVFLVVVVVVVVVKVVVYSMQKVLCLNQ